MVLMTWDRLSSLSRLRLEQVDRLLSLSHIYLTGQAAHAVCPAYDFAVQ